MFNTILYWFIVFWISVAGIGLTGCAIAAVYYFVRYKVFKKPEQFKRFGALKMSKQKSDHIIDLEAASTHRNLSKNEQLALAYL